MSVRVAVTVSFPNRVLGEIYSSLSSWEECHNSIAPPTITVTLFMDKSPMKSSRWHGRAGRTRRRVGGSTRALVVSVHGQGSNISCSTIIHTDKRHKPCPRTLYQVPTTVLQADTRNSKRSPRYRVVTGMSTRRVPLLFYLRRHKCPCLSVCTALPFALLCVLHGCRMFS